MDYFLAQLIPFLPQKMFSLPQWTKTGQKEKMRKMPPLKKMNKPAKKQLLSLPLVIWRSEPPLFQP